MSKKDTCICGCEECEGEGVWEITIIKEFYGEYGKKCGLYCTNCLIEELEGVHSGGGLTDRVIQKITRKVISPAVTYLKSLKST